MRRAEENFVIITSGAGFLIISISKMEAVAAAAAAPDGRSVK